MKKTLPFFLVLFLLAGCGQKKQDATPPAVDMTANGDASAFVEDDSINDELGKLVSTINFEIKITEPKLKKEMNASGFDRLPSVNINNPDLDKDKGTLVDAEEIVVPDAEATLIIDFPLENEARFDLKANSKDGFSRQQLIDEISKRYHQIYREEEETAKTKTVPKDKRTDQNRNTTDGKYGIWGHDLSDLYLNLIQVYKDDKGKVTLALGIES